MASPPDQTTEEEVPPLVAPVIGMGDIGVAEHLIIGAPAFAAGNPSIVNNALSDLNAQPPCPLGVFISSR